MIPLIVKPKLLFLAGLFGALLLSADLAPAGALPSGPLLREPNTIYLEDFVKKPLRVTLQEPAPIFFQPDGVRFLGTLRSGQAVEIQAIGESLYRVRGQAQQGQVAGWIDPKFLAPLKPEFLENLRQNAARRGEVEALIARNEVAINMTPEEVGASLGKPNKKTSRLDAAGRAEVWDYIRYERVPQQTTGRDLYGRIVTSTIYVKVPAGKLSIVFDKNLVTSLEQSEGTTEGATAKIVSAPLVFAF